MVIMVEDRGRKASQMASLLSDEKWHEFQEIERVYPLPEDGEEELLGSLEELDILEIGRKTGR